MPKILGYLALAALISACLTETVAAQQRPLLLVVHGRGQMTRDSAQLRREAVEALQTGARRVVGDSLIGTGDVRLIWYADLMSSRSRSDVSSACADLTQLDGANRDTPANGLTFLAAIAGALLDAASNDASDNEAVDLRSLSGDLRYLANTDVRCGAELRIARAIGDARREGRPVILVSHSLGAVVSWGYLARQRSSDTLPLVIRWVTLGSPLGSAELRQLVFGDETPVLSLPHRVGSWVNVTREGDVFASRITGLESGHASTSAAAAMMDVEAERETSDAHQLTGYLSDPVTARAVFSTWCGAMSATDRPAACGKMPARPL